MGFGGGGSKFVYPEMAAFMSPLHNFLVTGSGGGPAEASQGGGFQSSPTKVRGKSRPAGEIFRITGFRQ